jgi:hypothetical protein
VNEDRAEGAAIANLIGTDAHSIVGWVYRWRTGALAVMWNIHGPQPVLRCQPDLDEAQKREIDFDRLTKIRRRRSGKDQP